MAQLDDAGSIDAQSWLQRSPLLLRGTIGMLIAAVFIADWNLPADTAVGALYAIPILFSLWRNRRRATIAITILCIAALLVPLLEPAHRVGDLTMVGIDRACTGFALAIVGLIVAMRVAAEGELRQLRKVAVTTLRSLGEAVMTLDVQGRVRFVNRAAEALLGRARDELVGRPCAEVFVAREVAAARPPIVEFAGRGLPDWREALLSAHDGRRVPIEYSRTPIETAGGERFGEVLVFRDITTRKEHEEAMKRLAYRDELTGLPNRTSLLDRFQLEIAHARRNKEPLGVLFLDLDGFKHVNDRHGHAAGDALLVEVARRIRAKLRAGDTVARIGGDEFVVLLPGIAGESVARKVGEKLSAALKAPVEFGQVALRTSASFGLALYPRDGELPDALLQQADAAMYAAKSRAHDAAEVSGR